MDEWYKPAKKQPGLFQGLSPWSWALEPVRGCNLRCGHCATRLFTEPPKFMSVETWEAAFKVIRQVTPTSRVEMANAGEPTLHPHLPEFIRLARKISPQSQIQVTTNGTMLAAGKLKHRQLFDAGVNIVYVDMYAPREKHVKLAEESGIPFYEYHNKPEGAPGAWSYIGPHLKVIVLMDQPANWPDKRKKFGRLGTFYNHLDWEAAKPFGMFPVETPPARRCTQPFRYVSIHQEGWYELCCQDFFAETCGRFGSVHDGLEGFKKFWFGREIQEIRRKLHRKDRAGIEWCRRCNITFNGCDKLAWEDSKLDYWWDGAKWQKMPEDDPKIQVAALSEELVTANPTTLEKGI